MYFYHIALWFFNLVFAYKMFSCTPSLFPFFLQGAEITLDAVISEDVSSLAVESVQGAACVPVTAEELADEMDNRKKKKGRNQKRQT